MVVKDWGRCEAAREEIPAEARSGEVSLEIRDLSLMA
jgi:hypothetical protein